VPTSSIADVLAAIQGAAPQQLTPPIDPQAIIAILPVLISGLRESGVKISGRAEMDMEGLDPLTRLGTKPASYRVVIEFTL
jgi:hypothetical protein